MRAFARRSCGPLMASAIEFPEFAAGGRRHFERLDARLPSAAGGAANGTR